MQDADKITSFVIPLYITLIGIWMQARLRLSFFQFMLLFFKVCHKILNQFVYHDIVHDQMFVVNLNLIHFFTFYLQSKHFPNKTKQNKTKWPGISNAEISLKLENLGKKVWFANYWKPGGIEVVIYFLIISWCVYIWIKSRKMSSCLRYWGSCCIPSCFLAYMLHIDLLWYIVNP